MRSWGDLSKKEKELFDRKLKSRHQFTTEEAFEVEGLKTDMICRPLTDAEISRFEHILDAVESGLLPRLEAARS
jgi:hypothetical protein